jgi:hypothetical protein
MDTTSFLGKVLGDEGYYCVLAIKGDTRRQKFYPTIEAAQTAAEQFDGNGFDAYYALATFRDAESRTVDNVQLMRAFFLDLDCGPTKDYPDQSSALKALRAFCHHNKLPRPLLVNSGRGVHVYWSLETPIPLTYWLPVAERLKALCKAQGFACDRNVTADAARVLRVPGTHNYKDNPPREVTIFNASAPPPAIDFEAFSLLLGDDPIPVPAKLTAPYAPPEADAVTRALMGNRESRFKDILVKTKEGRGCEQLAYIIREQATMSEPMWRAGLSIAKFCSDGDKAAHVISHKHPEFSPDEMHAKMDRIKGPYLCSTFDEYNPGVCTECPLWGKIKSPINLGARVREAETDTIVVPTPTGVAPVQIPKYPRPYFRGANGGVYIRTVNDDGDPEDRCIYHYDLYVTHRLVDPEVGECLVFRLHLPRDGARDFTVPLQDITSREEFRKYMSKHGVGVFGKDVERLMMYTQAWLHEMQANSAADEAHRQFGWVGDGFEAFVLGRTVYYPGGRTEFNPPTKATEGLMEAFAPRGTLDGWKQNMAFFNRPGMELHQFVVLMGFGSLLMQEASENCAAIHLYSKDSGFGKTTAMMAATSAFGRPSDLVIKAADTNNSHMLRGEVYRSLLLPIDEVTNLRGMELSQLAYQFTGGRQRNRLARSGNVERVRGREWKLLAVTTGNASVIDAISSAKAMPKAEAQRILEVRVDRVFQGHEDKETTTRFSKSLQAHYGHAGPLFIQWILDNPRQAHALCETVQKRVDTAAKLGPENRFWSDLASRTLAAGIICSKLGLIYYDMQALFQFIVTVIRQAKGVVAQMTTPVETLLTDYITENWNNLLRIKSTDDLRKNGANNNGLDTLLVPEAQPRGQLVARYETDTKRLYMLPKPFKMWCVEQQLDHGAILAEMHDKMGAKRIKIRLGKGTNLSLPSTDVIAVYLPVMDPNEAAEEIETVNAPLA